VFDCRVELLSPANDVTARGAAYAAGRTMGWYSSEIPPYDYIASKGTFLPNSMNVPIYERMFGIFYKLYPALQSAFAEMYGSDR
jgi:sugar (pentulose or hexulose) kinase